MFLETVSLYVGMKLMDARPDRLSKATHTIQEKRSKNSTEVNAKTQQQKSVSTSR